MAERIKQTVSERLMEKYEGLSGIAMDAYSTRRVNGQTGYTDVLTTIRLAPDPESTRKPRMGNLLQGLDLLPREDYGYQEGRVYEVGDHGRTIVSVQVFSKQEDVPVIK